MKVTQRLLLDWVYMLCFLGGFVNTVSVIKYSYTISHFTGNISKTAINIANGNFIEVFKILFIIICFVIGAGISGCIVEDREFNLKKRYGYCIFILGLGLLFLHFVAGDSWLFFYYLPFMMGVQNGLFICYKGVVVRTSHVSGSVTDAGVYLGHFLRGKKGEMWKGIFCFFMVVSFLVGGFFGVEFYIHMKENVFVIISIGYFVVAGVYLYLRHRYRHLACFGDGCSAFK